MRLADQTCPDLADSRPLVILPLGSCEQHGPHLPLDTDHTVAESVRGVSDSGVLGDPSGASAQHGEELLAGLAVQLAEDIRAWRVSDRGRLGRLSVAPAGGQG